LPLRHHEHEGHLWPSDDSSHPEEEQTRKSGKAKGAQKEKMVKVITVKEPEVMKRKKWASVTDFKDAKAF
jgi:hypothetical protein